MDWHCAACKSLNQAGYGMCRICGEYRYAWNPGSKIKAYEGSTEVDGIERDPKGGLSSRLDVRFDLIPPKALGAVAEICKIGNDVYGPTNWRSCEVSTHINHALAHINTSLQIGGLSKRELAHAATRLLMAIELL